MRVESVELRDFMSHRHTLVKFPEKGLVLVRGPNGAGKSSIAEAVSIALWNRPLRRKVGQKAMSLWRTQKGFVTVVVDGLRVLRPASGKVAWHPIKEQPQKFENARKAQEELEQRVGPWEVWARTGNFKSQDAAHFTLATDSERKRLIEALLGLDVFDPASEACRQDLRATKRKLDEARSKISVLEERVKGLEERQRDLDVPSVRVGKTEVTSANYDAVVAKLKKMIAPAEGPTQVQLKAEREAERECDRLRERIRHAEGELRSFKEGKCPTCGAKLDQARRRAQSMALDKLQVDLRAAEKREAAAREAVALAQKQAQEARSTSDKAERALDEVRAWKRAQDGSADRRKELAEKLEDAFDELDTVRLDEAQLSEDLLVLEAADKVLGMGGVRSHVLHSALAGIEAVANAWLARLASSGDYAIAVRLKPYTENATGGVRDAISLEIEGVSNGGGYGPASDGERRRVDVSLLFALAEIAAGSRSADPGTLFFDEVFDALDGEGKDAVCEVLFEMAEKCCVIVITHDRFLQTKLEGLAVATWDVEGGKINE